MVSCFFDLLFTISINFWRKNFCVQEEVAALNLAKYRQAQQQLDEADERVDVAENSLAKLRARARTSASVVPVPFLMTSVRNIVLFFIF